MNDYIANPGDSFTFSRPMYVGHWQIGGPGALQVHMERRPPWLHRYMTHKLLGWVWIDAVPQ